MALRLQKWREKLPAGWREKVPEGWPFGRWIVVISIAVAAAWWVQRTLGAEKSLYQGFMEGLAAGFVVAVVLGNFERRWGGAKQKRAEVSPAGASEEFEEATEETVETLNAKMNALFNDLNGRVDELEKRVLGESTSDADA